MGHFGRPAISRAWFAVAFPALTLNHLRQGGLILADPTAVTNPIFLLLPGWAGLGAPGACHRRDGHRLPGGHHRRLFDVASGHASGVPAAAAGSSDLAA